MSDVVITIDAGEEKSNEGDWTRLVPSNHLLAKAIDLAATDDQVGDLMLFVFQESSQRGIVLHFIGVKLLPRQNQNDRGSAFGRPREGELADPPPLELDDLDTLQVLVIKLRGDVLRHALILEIFPRLVIRPGAIALENLDERLQVMQVS